MSSPAHAARSLAALCCALLLCACGGNLKPGAATISEALQGAQPSPLESAQMATDRYDANARYVGTLALANESFAGEPIYLKLFENNINDVDPAVRLAAIRGLANHGEPRHVSVITPLLKDDNILVRIEAARALQRLHHEDAIAPLLISCSQPDPYNAKQDSESEPEVRAEAAFALGQYDTAQVVRGLIKALDDTDLSVNRSAQHSLKTLTGQDFGLDANAWNSWLNQAADKGSDGIFLGRGLYTYPVYNRKKRIYEYFPFVPKPPNEVAAPPAGMPR